MQANERNPRAFSLGKTGLLLFIIALFALYFVRSYVLFLDIIKPVGMEECHTGAAAREILERGFVFPINEYTPEYYENSIIVETLLTVVSFRLLGPSRFSLEFVPFLLSFVSLILFCSLLRRGGFSNGIWFFIVSYFFGSMMFIYLTMDSLGNHVVGLFVGIVILYLFYTAYITRKSVCFYALLFSTGLGLFMHLGSMLFAGLCLIVYLLYRPAEGKRPRPSTKTALKGAAFFCAGAIPFVIFLIKTNLMSVTYLFGVVHRRSIGTHNVSAYAAGILEQLVFQFDDRTWLLAAFCIPAALAPLLWFKYGKRNKCEPARLLHFIACLFPACILAAVVIFSGGEFTTYYTYFLPMLFLAGAVAVSLMFDILFSNSRSPAALQAVFFAALISVLFSGIDLSHLNFSIDRTMRKLTADDDTAFCYWRFGRCFGNYVKYNDNSNQYARRMLDACGNFDSNEKKDECLWGWAAAYTGFKLDSESIDILGPDAAGLYARSVGGWADSIADCFVMEKAFIDDCILGHIERRAINMYSFNPPWKQFVRIPCLPEEPRFTGLVENIRGHIRSGASGPQDCPDNIRLLCIEADAYCASIRKDMEFCINSYGKTEERELCQYVFQQVWMAKEAEVNITY